MKIKANHNGFNLGPNHVHAKTFQLELTEKEMQLIVESVGRNHSDYPNDSDDERILLNMSMNMTNELQK